MRLDIAKVFLAVIAVACSSQLCLAQQGGFDAYLLGIGRRSCATWQQNPRTVSEGEVWIFGFWSALNIANPANHLVGRDTDSAGVVGEVKKACDAHPSATLSDVILDVYHRLEPRNAKKP